MRVRGAVSGAMYGNLITELSDVIKVILNRS